MEKEQSSLKTFGAVLIDSLIMLASYMLGKLLWQLMIGHPIKVFDATWRVDCIILFLSFWLVSLFVKTSGNILSRGRVEEFYLVVRNNFLTLLVSTLVLFVMGDGVDFSRGILAMTILVNVFLTFGMHCLVFLFLLRRHKKSKSTTQVMLITTMDRYERVLAQIGKYQEWGRRISCIAIMDAESSMIGREIDGIPIVANYEGLVDAAKRLIVDEAFFHVPYQTGESMKIYVEAFEQMGVTVHMSLQILENFGSYHHTITSFGGYPVVTFCERTFPWNQMLVKRIMDICGALVGLFITGIAILFVAIPLKVESPGPLFFKQKRVGKNGRYFMIYKFRSMYMDAEERKKELMAKNEMKGAMFKMTDDPRVTKVGKFIRATSIDELPQFWNVLKGDMSLVGTRPPTVEEFKEYRPDHKRRLSLKPGLSGMWQVSGRSNISDFEEVVKLDLEYIDNWSLALDFKIILKTIAVVFARVGSK